MAIRQTRELDDLLQVAADRTGVTGILLVPGEPACFRGETGVERGEGDALSSEDILDIATAAVGETRLVGLGDELGQVATSCSLPGVLDARLCVSRTHGGHSIAIRLLPGGDLTDLAARVGVPEPLVEAALQPWGLVLVTGPSGSGKTTTQYALLEAVNARRACHICTVEYSIGMRLPAKRAIVQQREVGVDVPDAVAGIAASMGQDLDVLLVGELRDAETLEACIRCAYHGHLVITQLHAPTPEAAISRAAELVDDTTRSQLATSLRAVAAQRLLRRADGAGRVPVFELRLPDDRLRGAIREGRELPPGSHELEAEIERLVREGLVTTEAAREALARA